MKSRSLVLVRHCESAVDRLKSPHSWDLNDRGLVDSLALATSDIIVDASVIAAGSEPKMVHSLEPMAGRLGVNVVKSSDFMESHSSGWFSDGDFHLVVRRFFDQPDVSPAPGWETADDAIRRLMSGLRDLDKRVGESRKGPIVVCSGGRLLTAFLVSIGILNRKVAFDAWRAIRMPDICIVDFDHEGNSAVAIPFGHELW
ncbi:MAG: histidine phosphatase family protein [Ilumatobacteraceae bacterium]